MSLLEMDRIPRLEQFDGEDTCELVNVIEDSFGLEFTSDDLVEAETVARLAKVISEKLTHPRSERCLSAIVFYRLRRTLRELFQSTRAQVRPQTRLDELMPWTSRRTGWRRLQEHMGVIPESLTFPLWLLCLDMAGSVAVVWMCAPGFLRFTGGGLLLAVAWFPTIFILLKLSSPFGRSFPPGCRTVGELAKATLARNYNKIAKESGGASPLEILQVLRQL